MKNKIQSFKDLIAWQESHKLVIQIYKVSDDFPKHEVFGLSSQLRRASVSITSNIAEGFSRSSYKEKLQFYSMAHGSLTEVENQLIIAKDLEYITLNIFDEISTQLLSAHKLLNALIAKTREFLDSKF